MTPESRRRRRVLISTALQTFNRIRLPGPSVLPVAGAVVGLYAGLAAGLFANLIALMSGVVFRVQVAATGRPRSLPPVLDALTDANWHLEFALVGAPMALAALWVARMIEPGGPRDEVKRRLRILAYLVLGALALYYPLVALSAVNSVFGHPRDIFSMLKRMPWWLMVASPAVGGVLVGALLRRHPETHGHGVPEVVAAVQRARDGLPARRGVLKLLASAVTIGTGGSAGREGPIVYGGAAFASAVGRVLGFSRKELGILLACGAGAGIAASFNAPIAGAVFAMEIILREFELKVFSPIILASVTATMVGRGVMGGAPMLERISYRMASGWEIVAYVALGLVCGLVAYAFIRMLHHSENFFSGRMRFPLSRWLGALPLPVRAGLGGAIVGGLALWSPSVWGSGHEFINLAALNKLGFWFLITACALKLIATSITIGSGGSGGTFFPSAVIGAMAGGAFGAVVHKLFPLITAPAGAYAVVGVGGAVAGLTRGPLTGMMMLYELSGNYAIILPLMVTCAISSALCHALVERRAPRLSSDAALLASTPIRRLMDSTQPVSGELPVSALVDLLLTSEDGALAVSDSSGRPCGVVLAEQVREDARNGLSTALQMVHRVPTLNADLDLATAVARMEEHGVDALPVIDPSLSAAPYGVITRAAIRRFLFRAQATQHDHHDQPVAATELSR